MNKHKINNINNEENIRENHKYINEDKKIDFDNDNKIKSINCINCKTKINNINNCDYCYGYLCPSCKDFSNKNNKIFSKINSLNLSKIILKEYNYDSKNYKLKEGKIICKSCNKKQLIKHFCINCRAEFCMNCAEKHNNDNSEHILILLKNNGSKPKLEY